MTRKPLPKPEVGSCRRLAAVVGRGRPFKISSTGMRAQKDQVSVGVPESDSSGVGPVWILVVNQFESSLTQARCSPVEFTLRDVEHK